MDKTSYGQNHHHTTQTRKKLPTSSRDDELSPYSHSPMIPLRGSRGYQHKVGSRVFVKRDILEVQTERARRIFGVGVLLSAGYRQIGDEGIGGYVMQ